MKKPLRWLATLTALLLPIVAMAQQKGLEIDIIGGNASALPITVVPMPYQAAPARRPPTSPPWCARTLTAPASSVHCRRRRSSSARPVAAK